MIMVEFNWKEVWDTCNIDEGIIWDKRREINDKNFGEQTLQRLSDIKKNLMELEWMVRYHNEQNEIITWRTQKKD